MGDGKAVVKACLHQQGCFIWLMWASSLCSISPFKVGCRSNFPAVDCCQFAFTTCKELTFTKDVVYLLQEGLSRSCFASQKFVGITYGLWCMHRVCTLNVIYWSLVVQPDKDVFAFSELEQGRKLEEYTSIGENHSGWLHMAIRCWGSLLIKSLVLQFIKLVEFVYSIFLYSFFLYWSWSVSCLQFQHALSEGV